MTVILHFYDKFNYYVFFWFCDGDIFKTKLDAIYHSYHFHFHLQLSNRKFICQFINESHHRKPDVKK